MRIGRLDRRIVIQQRTDTKDSHGDPVPAWSALATVWAEKLPMRGAERFQSQQTLAQADHRWRIRHRTDVTEKMRISHESEYYDIQSVLEIGRGKGTELVTKLNAS